MASSTLNGLNSAAPAATSLFYHVASPFGSGDDKKATGTLVRQGLATTWSVYKQGLPMMVPASGTTDAVGAFTLGTALTNSVFPAACYCYFPANTVNDSHAAGWYYCTMSTTTAGIMFQDRYDPSDTPPTIPGSPTACTTANNWTGVTTAAPAAIFTVPAGALGANGFLDAIHLAFSQTSNANAKSFSVTFGAFNAVTTTTGSLASAAQMLAGFRIANSGSTAAQISTGLNNAAVMTYQKGTVDTTAAVTVTLSLTHGTATDNVMIMPFMATITSNGA